jgi:uncharacterized protein YjbJ (UPF0337 family)
MTPDTFTRQWAQIRQQLRGWWDRLTEQDLDQIAGHQDQLVRVIQERYQLLRERAQGEVDQRLQAYQAAGGSMAEAMAAAAAEAASRVTRTAEPGHAAAAGPPALDPDAGDLISLVRRHPITALLVGLGVGVWLARRLGKPRPSEGGSAVIGGPDPSHGRGVMLTF